MNLKRWLIVQTSLLAAGTLYTWYTVVQDFRRFYSYEGTLFKIQDCIVPNPVVTPCFYGAIGFFVALLWSVAILRKRDEVRRRVLQTWLALFLLAGTIFGAVNTGLVMWRFYTPHEGLAIGCSGVPTDNPFTTPCFIGTSDYLLSFLVAGFAWRLARRPRDGAAPLT